MKLRLLKSERRKFTVLDDVSGIIPPSRICLLLGPPGSGKSTLLKALAGKMQNDPTIRVRFMHTAVCLCAYSSCHPQKPDSGAMANKPAGKTIK